MNIDTVRPVQDGYDYYLLGAKLYGVHYSGDFPSKLNESDRQRMDELAGLNPPKPDYSKFRSVDFDL